MELVAVGGDGTCSMKGTEWMQTHAQFVFGDQQVGGVGQGGLIERSPFVMSAPVGGVLISVD